MSETNEKLGGFPFVIGGLSFYSFAWHPIWNRCVDLGNHDE